MTDSDSQIDENAPKSAAKVKNQKRRERMRLALLNLKKGDGA